MRPRLLLLAVAATACAAGCSLTIDWESAIPCAGPADCNGDYRCFNGHCTPPGDPQCGVVAGTMVAGNADEVGRRLRTDGKFVVDVQDKPLREGVTLDRDQILRNEAVRRVRREDVIAFCQQLSVMLETGVPLAEALSAFQRQTGRREFRQVLSRLNDDVCSGETFSAAMGKWPRVFLR